MFAEMFGVSEWERTEFQASYSHLTNNSGLCCSLRNPGSKEWKGFSSYTQVDPTRKPLLARETRLLKASPIPSHFQHGLQH